MRVLAAAALLATTLAAQDDPLLELASRARAAPPEFAADLLLRLAGRSESPPERRIQWLEEAFRLAAGARKKVPLGTDLSTGIFRFLSGSTMGIATPHADLDTLTLQSLAVRNLLPLDRSRAMILFRSLQAPEPAASACDASAGYFGVYFRAVGVVYKQGFTPEERAEGRDLDFLIAIVNGMPSARGLEDVLDFFSLPLDDAAFPRLLSAFTAALGTVRTDGSGYTGNLTNRLLRVIESAQDRKLSVFPLISAVRNFLVRSLNGARCASRLPPGAMMAQEAQWFNDTLLVYGGLDTAQLQPIEPSEVQPAGTRETRFDQPSSQAARLVDGLKGVGSRPKEDRNSAQFEEAVRDLMRQVNQWRRDHREPEPLYVTIAAEFYRQLASISTSDALRRAALREQLDLLRRTPLREQKPEQWAGEMDALINGIRVNDTDLEWFREELRTSGEQVMPLYLECYELLAMPRIDGR